MRRYHVHDVAVLIHCPRGMAQGKVTQLASDALRRIRILRTDAHTRIVHTGKYYFLTIPN
jgi:ATP-dependent protease ClpP protease subunit